MSKKLTVAQIEKDQDLLLTGNTTHTMDELLSAMESEVGENHLADLTAEYLDIKKAGQGVKQAFEFTGMTTFTDDKGVERAAVSLTGKEGAKYISAGAVLVKSLQRVTQMPCFVVVTYLGDVKSANGTYANLKVQVLKAATK